MAIRFDDVAFWNDLKMISDGIKTMFKPMCVILGLGAIMLLFFYLIGEANTLIGLGVIIIGLCIYDRYFYKETGGKK